MNGKIENQSTIWLAKNEKRVLSMRREISMKLNILFHLGGWVVEMGEGVSYLLAR